MAATREKLTLRVTHDWCTLRSNETRWIFIDPVTGKEYEYWTASQRPLCVGWTYTFTAQVLYDYKEKAWFLKNVRGIKHVG